MQLNLHLARIFHTVVTEHGFSRAAEKLCISQSAVSKGVKELETQLGVSLIDRAGRGLARTGINLTEAGQSLSAYLNEIFALEHAALEDVQARIGLRQGALVIGASTTVAAYWLPALLGAFRSRHPHIEPKVVVGNTQLISEGLIECRMDLALVEGEVDEAGIVSTAWREETLQVVAAPQQLSRLELTPEGLSRQTWLVREQGSGTGEVGQRLLSACGIVPAHTVEIGSNEGIARAAEQGLGLALLSSRLVRDLIELNRLVEVPMPQVLTRPLFCLRRAKRPYSPAAQAFFSLLNTA